MTTMEFPALKDLEGKIEAKSKALAGVFDEAGPTIDLSQVKSIPGDTMAKAEFIRKANDELTDLGKQRDELVVVRKAAERIRMAPGPEGPGEGGSEPDANSGKARARNGSTKSLGQLFTESKAYKSKMGTIGPEAHLGDFELKTLMSTGAGWEPETTRTGRVVLDAQRPIQVADVIPQTTTSQSSVVFMEETTFTNAAVEVAESTQATPGVYPESALALTEQSSAVRKIATFLPVTDEQLEDEGQVRGFIDNRLPFMIRQRLDSQLLVGTGIAPNLRGLLNVVGIQTQAKGTDPVPDAVYKAITLVRTGTGQAMPNAVLFNPADWQDVRLLRTADGLYIWGNPSDAGPERIWGLQVVQAQALTQNTALVGDFANFSELATRRGIDVQVSNSHGTFFTEGKQAIRADIRVAFVVYRPAAFCTVTGV